MHVGYIYCLNLNVEFESSIEQTAYDGDEMFWYNTSMLMVEATLKDYENRRGNRIVSCDSTLHSMSDFQFQTMNLLHKISLDF